MFNFPRSLFLSSMGSLVCSLSLVQAQLQQASVYDEETETFMPYDARTLDDVDGYTTNDSNLEFSYYGGWKAHRVEATGFFRVEKIDGRWWSIDPEGYLYIHKAVNSVQLFDGYNPDDVYELLPEFGMNGTGNWSDEEIQDSRLKNATPLAYCPKYSFVSSYKNTRADRLPIAVFDDEFVTFCEEKAEQEFRQYVNDPHVYGYFIDNELSWTFTGGLESHLNVNDANDKNYQAAISFLADRNVAIADFTDEDADDYAAVMAERYFSVVCGAVRAVDPNHMILGPRLNKSWNRTQEFMEAAGRYLDIVAINHYHRWGSRSNELENIAAWTDRPLLISEFYAMEKITGYEETGAGWRVEDETSRALFYENFVTTQLEKPFIVGFHWFNFQDDYEGNDPTITVNNDPTIAKRGLINIEGDSYTELQASMKYMNDRIYDYIEHVDEQSRANVTITAEADAYFQDDANYGTAAEMLVRRASDRFTRSAYIRFDASSVTEDVVSAKIQLFGTSPDEKLTSTYKAQLVLNNSWTETGINADNAPAGSTVLASWGHGDDIEIDVTDELISALAGDSKLSIRVYDEFRNDLEVQYGAREFPDVYAQPKLVVYYEEDAIDYSDRTHLLSSENFEDGFVAWNSSGSDSILYTETTYAHQGDNAGLIRDNTSQSRLVSNTMELAEYTSVTVDFWYYTLGMDDGHDFWLQLSTDGGSNYTTVKSWVAGSDFINGAFKQGRFTIGGVTFTNNTILRFKCDAADNFDQVYLDQINVSATGRIELDSYDEWARGDSDLDDKTGLGDPDGDGIVNLMEYVLNGDPSNEDVELLPKAEVTENSFIFSFSRLADSALDTEQVFQYSSDAETWVDVNITTPKDAMVNLSEASNGIQDVKIIVDRELESGQRLFGRLKVTEP